MPDAREECDPKGMRTAAEQAALKDEAYYWLDNIRFLVQGVLFRVPRLPFILGSRYFTEKHGLRSNGEDAEPIVHLQSVSAPQFRIFLKFLFPMPSNNPLGSFFTKEEWITILSLCTAWHFPEFRKLAIQNLDGKLVELELIYVGRALCIPVFVLEGYRAIVNRPKAKAITWEEAAAIGHESADKLWTIRYRTHVAGVALSEEAVGRELHKSFADELAELGKYEEEGPVHPEDVREWVGVNEDGSRVAKNAPGPIYFHRVQTGDETKGEGMAPSDAKSSVHLGDFQEPPTGPRGCDITHDEDGWLGTSNGKLETETEEVQLARNLEHLKEEEREIRRKLQEVQSRELPPEGQLDLEAVKQARVERIKGELRKIEEAKRAEKELMRSLGEGKNWSGPDIDRFWVRLEDIRNHRAELEQRIVDQGVVEDGQFLRWDKEKAAADLNAELLECQMKQQTVEGQLNGVYGVVGDEALDASGTSETGGTHKGDMEAATIVEQGSHIVCAGEIDEEVQMAERRRVRRVLEGECKYVRQVKQVQLQKEAKLRAQETQYSKTLSNLERLLSQSAPGSRLPKKVRKKEKGRGKCVKNLCTVQAELKEVHKLLNIVCAEEARLENEIRLL